MTALKDTKYFPLPSTIYHDIASPESQGRTPKGDDWPSADASGAFSTRGSTDICLKSAFVVLRMFRYLTGVLVDKQLQLPGIHHANEDANRVRSSLPITMPQMACSAMQACYVMVMTLYRVKSVLVPGGTSESDTRLQPDLSFQDTERLVEQLRHGIEDSLHMLEKYQVEFAHIKIMYEELKMVYMVAFADV
jgi:hypothetical protein